MTQSKTQKQSWTKEGINNDYSIKELIFRRQTACTAAGASTNIVDQGAAGDSYDALWLVVNVTTATGTLGFDLETDDNSEFSGATKLPLDRAANCSDRQHLQRAVCLRAAKRYLRIAWTGTVSAGNMTAFLAKDVAI